MRIIAGRFRGKKLPSPDGKVTRPTSDRVREAVFSILLGRLEGGFEGLRVLDLFAGTGALGLEALSRGAMMAAFVETGAQGRAIIRSVIEDLGLGGQTRLLKRDATRLGPVGSFAPFDLVFLDPPYGRGLGEKALSSGLEGGWFAPGAMFVLEEKRGIELDLPKGFETLDARDYGTTSVHFLKAPPDQGTSFYAGA